MILKEVDWIRNNRAKLCPTLRSHLLDCYRAVSRAPCFLQDLHRRIELNRRKLPVIIQVEHLRIASIKALAAKEQVPVERELSIINAFATQISAAKLKQLLDNGAVKRVWYDREVQAVLDTASAVVKAQPLWQQGVTGQDVVVAVLDTGVYSHRDLEGRIIDFKDLVGNRTTPYDDNGHGTHVAGAIAGNGASAESRFRGPAPEAKLVGVKVLNKLGAGTMSLVIAGIQWCMEKKEELDIRVLNLSLGSPAVESYATDPVCQAAEAAWLAGIVVCAAAGNSGPEGQSISSPGIHPRVITVGALNDNNSLLPSNHRIADFSSRGPTIDGLAKPDVVAPGVDIVSLRAPSSLLDKQHKGARVGQSYISLSGTSMATPICAGVVAQILQNHPALTPDQVKTRLLDTASPLAGAGLYTQGVGVIDAQRATLADAASSEGRERLLQTSLGL